MPTVLSSNFDEKSGTLEVSVTRRVDSTNSQEFDEEIQNLVKDKDVKHICFNLSETEYVSSACLRVFLKYAKEYKDSSLVEVNPSVYDVLDMTGFKNFYHVEKKMKDYSVEGLEVIGKGATGTVYRVDADTIIKVFNDVFALDQIKREMDASKAAFVSGIATAIPYEVVKVGNKYGTIYELIKSKTLSEILQESGDEFDSIAKKYGKFMREMHEVDVSNANFKSTTESYAQYKPVIAGKLGSEIAEIYNTLLDSIPDRNTYVHGDFHPKNIMVTGNDFLLIDMGESSHGHPIFDVMALGVLRLALADLPEKCQTFVGISSDELIRLWYLFIPEYFGTNDEEKVKHISNVCLLYSSIRAIGLLALLPYFTPTEKETILNRIKELYSDKSNMDLSIFD